MGRDPAGPPARIAGAPLADCEPKDVQRVFSKPEVFAQCRGWLGTQYPRAELVAAASRVGTTSV